MRSIMLFAHCLWIAGCASLPEGGEPEEKTGAEVRVERPWEETIRPDVLAVMRRQEAMQPAVTALYERYMAAPESGFAGIAFEGEGLALYFKGELDDGMSAAIAAARQVAHVEVKPAAFSAAELRVDGAAIEAAMAADGGSDIQRVTYRYDGAGLEVERMPPAEVARIGAARARAGKPGIRSAEQVLAEVAPRAPVALVTGTALYRFQASRTSDSPPWNGGTRWTDFHDTNRDGNGDDPVVSCTTGFGVRASGRTWILTAAHCGSIPDVAYHNSVKMGPVNSDQWRYDMLLLDTSGWFLMFDGPSYTQTTKQVNDWGYPVFGELVCQSGATSGTVCNLRSESIGDYVQTRPDSDGELGYTVKSLVAARQMDNMLAAQRGDSGGPVFTLNGSGVRAKGILSGTADGTNDRVMTFAHWGTAIFLFGAYPRVGL